MATGQRYVFKLLGDMGRVVATRYHLSYQEIGRLAALVIPDAVMLRMVRETNGNVAAVLGPIEGALRPHGYTHFMVVPADVRAVEMVPVGAVEAEPVDALYRQLQETAQVLRDVLVDLGKVPGTETAQQRIGVQLGRLG